MADSVRTKHAELSLEEIADGLPGTADVMVWVGRRYAGAWYAAHGGNWPLAGYFLRAVRGRLSGLSVIRPKYAESIAAFDRAILSALLDTVQRRDLSAFEATFNSGVAQANAYHVAVGKSYIRWKLPSSFPDDLDLGPSPDRIREREIA